MRISDWSSDVCSSDLLLCLRQLRRGKDSRYTCAPRNSGFAQRMIKGSIVAVVTPMFPDGAVDWDSLSALVEWHIAEGTDGIVAVGTTGESATLNEIGRASCRERVCQYV